MKPSTYFGLLAEFGAAHIPVTKIGAKYFGHDDKTAKQYAAKAKYPFPVFQCSSKWMIDAAVFGEYLDRVKTKSQEEYKAAR